MTFDFVSLNVLFFVTRYMPGNPLCTTTTQRQSYSSLCHVVSPGIYPILPSPLFCDLDRAFFLWAIIKSWQVVRTEAVFQTHDPLFDKTWVFVAPSYDSLISVDLVDASTDKSVGVFETSVIALLQVRWYSCDLSEE